MKQEKNAVPKTPKQAFGQVLAEMRREKGLSQEQLGHEGGYHATYVSQLERGVKTPTLTTLLNLAQVLGVRAAEMVAKVEVLLDRVR